MEWKLLKKINNFYEIWDTPFSYLVCNKYEKIFKFFDKLKEAIDFSLTII